MCLIKTTEFPKKAKSDIIVYKIISPGKGGHWETPYRHTPVHFWDPLKSKHHPWRGIFGDNIESSGVHAYLNPKSSYLPTSTNFCVEAIIPKGTWYWLGTENEVASGKLIITNKYHPGHCLDFNLGFSKTKSLLKLGLDPGGALGYLDKNGIITKDQKKHSVPVFTLRQILFKFSKSFGFYIFDEDPKKLGLKVTLKNGTEIFKVSRQGTYELVYKTTRWFLENENKTNR